MSAPKRGYLKVELTGTIYHYDGTTWTYGKEPHPHPGVMAAINHELARLNSPSALDGTYSVSGLLDRAKACLHNVSGGHPERWKILVCEPDMSWHDEGHPDLDD